METNLCDQSKGKQHTSSAAPFIFGLRAEALLRLSRQEEAVETMDKGPSFKINGCIRFFRPVGSSCLLLLRAQVDWAAGRFNEVVGSTQRASRLGPNNKEANIVVRRTKAARYTESIIAYGEELGWDPHYAVLLSNRLPTGRNSANLKKR